MFLKVSRSGGFAGLMTSGELDTSGEPDAEVLEAVAVRLTEQPPGTGRPQPDRFVYRLEISAGERVAAVVIAEQDLDRDAAWLLDRVLPQE
ncbi:protealysin inhibitor emfourin [Kribbella sp. DT2]|uniref:protealysin inhibitor emfourin n=1 Tax=Kribbella sp. DT2 TaxID=3393427 RepID=UPI003CF97876